MYEFQWQLPPPVTHVVRLQLHARSGWFGWKTLSVDNLQIYRRSWFTGLEHRFRPSPTGPILHLRLLDDGHGQWRPVLLANGTPVPEKSRTQPPYVPHRPALVSVVTGLTYLAILIAIVMLPSTEKMLRALRLPHADRKLVLTVADPAAADLLHIEPVSPGRQVVNEPFGVLLRAGGGVPPYRWEASATVWPKGMVLNPATGMLTFLPRNPTDYHAEFLVVDAQGACAAGAIVVVASASAEARAGWPVIQTISLPSAVYGEPYEECLERTGDSNGFAWKRSSGNLPQGITLSKTTGCLAGTPARRVLAELGAEHAASLRGEKFTAAVRTALEAKGIRPRVDARVVSTGDPDVKLLCDSTGRWLLQWVDGGVKVLRGDDQYVATLTVEDSMYAPGDDIRPWLVPVFALALSLVGFWNMRRWGVLLLGLFLLAQVGIVAGGLIAVSTAALVLQAGILLVGLIHWPAMR